VEGEQGRHGDLHLRKRVKMDIEYEMQDVHARGSTIKFKRKQRTADRARRVTIGMQMTAKEWRLYCNDFGPCRMSGRERARVGKKPREDRAVDRRRRLEILARMTRKERRWYIRNFSKRKRRSRGSSLLDMSSPRGSLGSNTSPGRSRETTRRMTDHREGRSRQRIRSESFVLDEEAELREEDVLKEKTRLNRRFRDIPLLVGTLAYWVGCFIGLVGLFAVIHRTDSNNNSIHTVGSVVGVMICLVFILSFGVVSVRQQRGGIDISRENLPVRLIHALLWTGGAFIFSSVFFSDWILAAVEGNWAGIPGADYRILYWTYFVAKRLPMLSI
jgi:hypothetical protein